MRPQPHPPTAPDAAYYMRLLVDRVPTMLAYWDRDLICRFANRAYEGWFGVDPDRLLGTSIRDLLGPELFALNHPYMLKALAGERQVFERIVPGPGGVERHSLAEYIPDAVDGEVRGFLVQVTNLTELKETQDALKREMALRAELEQRTAELQALLQERTEMLHVLAHEVRQPLNNASAALQSAQVALRKRAEEIVPGRVEQAQQVLGDVLGSIDNTLAVATLLVRAEPVPRYEVDLDALAAIAIGDMAASERGRIQVIRETPTRTGLMDMSLMRLALRNLLSNALRSSPQGSPVVLRIAETDGPPTLRLTVTDHGTGVPPEVRPRLFRRGTHGLGGRGAQGLGLGLYIVERVMALHQGSACLTRTGAGGSTFELVLPQLEAQEPGLDSSRSSVRPDQSP